MPWIKRSNDYPKSINSQEFIYLTYTSTFILHKNSLFALDDPRTPFPLGVIPNPPPPPPKSGDSAPGSPKTIIVLTFYTLRKWLILHFLLQITVYFFKVPIYFMQINLLSKLKNSLSSFVSRLVIIRRHKFSALTAS